MRLIDADALIEKCGEWYVEEGPEDGFIGTIKQLIDTQPTIQPEIIRCKDCKYYKYGICMKIGANKSFYGFCDWAERREDG